MSKEVITAGLEKALSKSTLGAIARVDFDDGSAVVITSLSDRREVAWDSAARGHCQVACAIGTTIPVAIAGALLFYLSDACIGWSRFVGDFPQSRMAIITTYHLGQIGLVIGLAAAT